MRPRTNILKLARGVHRSTVNKMDMSTAEVELIYTIDRDDTYDRNDAAAVLAAAEAGTRQRETVNASVHFISPEEVAQRGLRVISVGDVIVDFLHDLDLDTDADGKPRGSLEFGIMGKRYVRKEGADDDLAEAVETVISNALPYQTVVLSPRQS